MVYLTFDDGPIPEVTPWVLDVLEQHAARATFFMVGENALRHPELVQEVRRRGHAVGNHTGHHVQGLRMSTAGYMAEVALGAEATGNARMMRPPHGLLWPWQLHALKRAGHVVVMHDVVCMDYDRTLTGADVERIAREYIRSGSVVVLHDSLKTVERLRGALPGILEWLRAEGYVFGILTPRPNP